MEGVFLNRSVLAHSQSSASGGRSYFWRRTRIAVQEILEVQI